MLREDPGSEPWILYCHMKVHPGTLLSFVSTYLKDLLEFFSNMCLSEIWKWNRFGAFAIWKVTAPLGNGKTVGFFTALSYSHFLPLIYVVIRSASIREAVFEAQRNNSPQEVYIATPTRHCKNKTENVRRILRYWRIPSCAHEKWLQQILSW